MVLQFNDLPSYLNALWTERKALNRAYSLRALARDLGLDPGHLSGLLHNKRGLSTPKALEVADRLGLPPRERSYLLALTQLKQAQTDSQRRLVERQMRDLKRDIQEELLDLDTFAVVSDPIHFALLAYLESPAALQSPIAMSKRLSVDRTTLRSALDRLVRVGLLSRQPTGRYQVMQNRTLTRSPTHNEALVHYHQKLHTLAARALNEQDIRERAVGSETLRFDSSHLPRVKELLENTYAELITLAAHPDQADAEVYTLITTFFRRTHKNKKENRT